MPNALKQYAEARPTPRNKLMGLLADTLTRANEYATLMDPRYADKRQNQTLGLLADAVQLGSIAKTADRMSYGEPLTNAGKANVPMLKPETADALMMAPLSPRNALAMMGGGGFADDATMRAMDILFKPRLSFKERAFIDEAGTYIVPKEPNMTRPMYEYRNAAFNAGVEKYSPKYEGFFRFTNNPKEIELARAGALRASRNHADGVNEIGLSVADAPHYGIQGYKHGYQVDGDIVGYGSDGEPLLNPATLRVLSDRMRSSSDIVAADHRRQAKILKDAGLPRDYLVTFNFLNDPTTFKPLK